MSWISTIAIYYHYQKSGVTSAKVLLRNIGSELDIFITENLLRFSNFCLCFSDLDIFITGKTNDHSTPVSMIPLPQLQSAWHY